jgi:hypothetical protein
MTVLREDSIMLTLEVPGLKKHRRPQSRRVTSEACQSLLPRTTTTVLTSARIWIWGPNSTQQSGLPS